jgi:hypothetical protein
MPVPLTAACVVAAAALFGVPEPTLWTIIRTEGGQVGACVPQTNGTHDCGPAQINSETWAPELSRVVGRSVAQTRIALRDDGCFNIWAASYVLKAKLQESQGDTWEAAGRYNSKTPVYKLAYQIRLAQSYYTLFVRRRRH